MFIETNSEIQPEADPAAYLHPTQYIASDDPGIVEYATYAIGDAFDPRPDQYFASTYRLFSGDARIE